MGARRLTGGMGLALAFLLAFGYVVGVAALEPARPTQESEAPIPLYARDDHCDPACGSLAAMDVFHVTEGTGAIHFVVYAILDPQSGPARVSVIDPSGDLRYDRVFTGAQRPFSIQDEATWSGEAGEWTLARSYAGTAGFVQYQAWADVAPHEPLA